MAGIKKGMSNKISIELICKTCFGKVLIHPYRQDTFKFCSRKCFRPSIEAKAKQSKTMKNLYSDGTKIGFKKGNRYSLGDKNINWKGGITPLNRQIRACGKYEFWRDTIFERDNYICRWCDKRGGYLVVDHIISLGWIIYKNKIKTLKEALKCQELWNTDNGRILCKECHSRTDTFGWKAYYLIYNENR